MTERAKLWRRLAVAAVMCATGSGCTPATNTSAPRPVYDHRTRQLVRLDWDANLDGRVEQRTYFVNGIAVRSEVDADGDARVDRWEYVDGQASVMRVGASSASDGIEDTWTFPADANGEVRVDHAQYRDGTIDRREFFREATLLRAEEDANRDGLADKWEVWTDGALREASYDTSFSRGRPDRRLVYEGRTTSLETDADGDGRFERLGSNPPGIRRQDQ